jgi:hypothetical protein
MLQGLGAIDWMAVLLGLAVVVAGILLVDLLQATLGWRRQYVFPPWGKFASDATHGQLGRLEERLHRLREYVFGPQDQKLAERQEGFQRLYALSDAEAAAQLATFRWQMDDPLLLRLGRVADTLADLTARADSPYGSIVWSVSLRLVRLPLLLRPIAAYRGHGSAARAPCVVVQTHAPDVVRSRLRGLARWLDVAVAVEPPRLYYETARCEVSGRRGAVGGSLRAGAEHVGVTCAHTLGRACHSRTFSAQLDPYTLEPDIALLASGPCFGNFPTAQPVVPCDLQAAKLLAETEVRMVPSGKRGKVLDVSMTATYERRTHDFPHVLIGRKVMTVFDLRLPWGLHFSVPGDSGSWVMDEQGRWLGVLVAANEDRRMSYAAVAAPVLTYLDEARAIGPGPQCFPNP